MTLFSIITPSYNQADFLEQTILSVLEQDYADVEYLIADGASTDGSADIIRRYALDLSWWCAEVDAGQADAINKGFSRAKGEIIAWLNSDDIYLPETFTKVAEIFAKNPDAGIIYGDVLSIDADGNPINIQHFVPYQLSDLMAFNIISQPAVFMRRSFLEQAGYLDLEYHFLLDHHLWLRMAQLAPMIYVPQILAKARYHADAKNIAHAERFGKEAFKILDWMETQPLMTNILKDEKEKILAGAHHLDAFYLVEAGKMSAGLKAYWRTFRYNPKMALKSWKRILYAFLSLLGFSSIRKTYLKLRQKILSTREKKAL
ncbi:MAG: glycosyltransferase [Anaerolineae bacterium]|jgi:glycosyltransferase involved in cell wall biosynthesis|nr:glycosyltransferase [Anaerolineae bacterium]MBT7074121.1 glycosyltransferase [Anaerolineae bacterium]MBT7781350.1 glycosyltransferase [Anaerolineae bacterium]